MQLPEWPVLVGYGAVVLNVWGNLMLANLRSSGWVVRILTNLAWIVYSVHARDGLPVMANHVTFLLINLWGWHKWRKAKQQKATVA